MRQFRMHAIACPVLLASLMPQTANAFPEHGQRIIGLIAEHFLSPETRTKVNAILAGDTDPLAPHDIAGAATRASLYMESNCFAAAGFEGAFQALRGRAKRRCSGCSTGWT